MSWSESQPILGAIEGGGTKFSVAIGRGPGQLLATRRIVTRSPESTLKEVVSFFREHRVEAVGLACFGPIELREGADHGRILATPKLGWTGFPVRAHLEDALGLPVAVDTDVNAAAMAEARWGAGRGVSVLLYVTVGTGVGGGILIDGRPLHGLLHPELGHVSIPGLPDSLGRLDDFPGVCPFHGRCLEGLISGPSIEARLGVPAEHLPMEHPIWTQIGNYLGLALANYTLTFSPERIIVGGGVGGRTGLLARCHSTFLETLGDYIQRIEVSPAQLASFLVAPGLGSESGLLGALALAQDSLYGVKAKQ